MMRDPQKYSRVCCSLAFLLQITSLVLVIHDSKVIGAGPPDNVPHFRSRDEVAQQRPIPKYKYSYNVHGLEGDQHGHQVSHDGPYASGKYYVKLNQGTSQNVEYYTDHLGYHPKVVYRSNLDSGKSGTRVILGANSNSFSTSEKSVPQLASSEYASSTEIPTKTQNTDDTIRAASSTPQATIENAPSFVSPDFGQRLPDVISSESNGTLFYNNYPAYDQKPIETAAINSTNAFNIATPAVTANNSLPQLGTANVPTDAYLHPEFNEITSGFLGKIVSVIPGIKFLRPIIVTDANAQGQAGNVTGAVDVRPDQAVDSAQLHEFRDTSPYAQLVLAGVSILHSKNDTVPATSKEVAAENEPTKVAQEPESLRTVVDVEPQTIEKQAVITTNIDISKSVPLTMNFLPDVDNNLSDQRFNGFNYPVNPPAVILQEQQRPVINYPPNDATAAANSVLPFNYPPNLVASQPPQPPEAAQANYQTNDVPTLPPNLASIPVNFANPALQQDQYLNGIGVAPQTLYNGPTRFFHLPFPPNLQQQTPLFVQPQGQAPPAPGFRFVSIPVLQHQPNIIPLNQADGGQNQVETAPGQTSSPNPTDTLNQSASKDESAAELGNQVPLDTITKRENQPHSQANAIVSDFYSSKPIKPSFIDPLFNSHQPLAFQVPAAQLIPYVQQITNPPHGLGIHSHPYAQHFLQQHQQLPYHQQQQQQTGQVPARAHSVAYNVRLFPKDQYRKPPVKSAPFKPSHPVWDSIYPPQHMYHVPYYVLDKVPNERKARDSTYRRQQRRVRRLFVEYGGFKPPMIPSTLLEVEETSDKSEVPTNTDDL